MNISDIQDCLRSLFRIRQQRSLPPPGPKPAFGATIVNQQIKIQLFLPIDYEQWDWLTGHGWRTMDMRENRRRYFRVPRNAVQRMLSASKEEREHIHQRVISYRYPRSRLE
ncbi:MULTISPECIES: hypothetical protein [Undibacterium]|jgi:hypothetical protein|uniref:Uncharacterized protein n=1 Tax=Undibacterium curvum TaxID=2762294 RepID=A0ABR7A9N7_9BURK|nr:MULTISPECIES: hypothetical protein [Undibacterium]MBC3933618.1 hypothetical protein [Undibacterium curvum]NDI87188.1 hypothetical protein [Undibacterium crateris]